MAVSIPVNQKLNLMKTLRGSPTSTWVSWKFGKVAVNAANFFVAPDVIEPVEGVANLPQIVARFGHSVYRCSPVAFQLSQCVDSVRRNRQGSAKVQFGHWQRIFAGDVT
jgi:hypothetical protein